MDPANLVPYVVPESFFELPASAGGSWRFHETDMLLPLGHHVYAVLMELNEIGMKNVHSEELQAAGMTPQQAHQQALENLDRLVKENTFQTQILQEGEDRLLVWYGNWLAASCLRLPTLPAWASQQLGSDDLLVSIPQRELMVIFPRGDRPSRDRVRAFITRTVEGMDKLITFDLFEFSADGPQPFQE